MQIFGFSSNLTCAHILEVNVTAIEATTPIYVAPNIPNSPLLPLPEYVLSKYRQILLLPQKHPPVHTNLSLSSADRCQSIKYTSTDRGSRN